MFAIADRHGVGERADDRLEAPLASPQGRTQLLNGTQALRNDQLGHRASNGLLARQPEGALGAWIPVGDQTLLVQRDYGAVCAIEDELGEIEGHRADYPRPRGVGQTKIRVSTRSVCTGSESGELSGCELATGLRVTLLPRLLLAVDLKPDACTALVGVDRPTVGERIDEQEIILWMTGLVRRADQLTSTSQLDANDIAGHPDAQLDELV
jgi:hypothetical protein